MSESVAHRRESQIVAKRRTVVTFYAQRSNSVNSHRDRGGRGRETQNCRHFWPCLWREERRERRGKKREEGGEKKEEREVRRVKRKDRREKRAGKRERGREERRQARGEETRERRGEKRGE